MSTRPTLQAFVQHELRLAEPVFESMLDGVLEHWRKSPPGRLANEHEAPRLLTMHRVDFVRHAAASLREQVQRGQAPAPAAAPRTGRLELALVEDDEITTDIEIARVVERAGSELESEIRDLRTFTSALVGDINTSRETNPLRPEVWVRALMAGIRAVPMSRAMQTSFLRVSSDPLIRAIRDTYLAACQRLQSQGVSPAAHRTIVNEGQTIELTDAMRARRELERPAAAFDDGQGNVQSGWVTQPSYGQPASVQGLLRQVEQGLVGSSRYSAGQASIPAHVIPVQVVPVRIVDLGAAVPAQEIPAPVQRLSELFDAIMADRRLPRDCLPLLSRYYPGALRHALTEPAAIDDPDHPMWRFVDHLAFLMHTRAVGDLPANLAFAQSLVDQIAANPALEPRHFQSAIARIAVHERQRFARAVSAAADDIAELTHFTQHAATGFGPSLPQALDAGRVDATAVTQRRRTGDEKPLTPTPPDPWKPGVWLTLFLRGQWRRALVLWRGPERGPWLMLDATEARHWAVRRQSIDRLSQEGLARELVPRSLLRDAFGRVGQVQRDPGTTLFG